MEHLLLSRTHAFLTLVWEPFARGFYKSYSFPIMMTATCAKKKTFQRHFRYCLICSLSQDLSPMPLSSVQDPTVSLEISALEPYLVSLKRNILFSLVVPLRYSLGSLYFLARHTRNSVSSLQ